MTLGTLKFIPWGNGPRRKTQEWLVVGTWTDHKAAGALGKVKWHVRFHCYAFQPSVRWRALFLWTQLQEIAAFCETMTTIHRRKESQV